MEIGEPGPYTRLVYAEDDKVLGFDGGDIGLVCDGEGASGQIAETLLQNQMTNSCGMYRKELTVAVKTNQRKKKRGSEQ